MATLNQIKVNTGTEDSPSYVLHDVHDKRLDDGASSLVTTCTHLLATNAALSSFNPITSANLASVLGGWSTSFILNANESIEVSLPADYTEWIGIYSLFSQNMGGLSLLLYISYNENIVVSGMNTTDVTIQHAVNSSVIKITNGNSNGRQFFLQRIASRLSLV